MRYPLLLVFVVSGWAGSVAGAQAQSGGGLFGATRADTDTGDRFNVTVSLGGGYDSEVPAEFRSRVSAGGPQTGGFSTVFDSTAEYSKAGRRGTIAGTAQTSFRYYQQLGQVLPVSHSAAIGTSVALSRTATLELKQAAAYSPSFVFQLFPSTAQPELGDAPAAAPDLRADENGSYSYNSGVTVSVGSARGNQFSVGADYGRTHLQREEAARSELATTGARARYAKGFGRASGLSLEYRYSAGDFGLGITTEHGVTIGAEYVRPLSTSRSLSFRLGLGPAVVSVPELAATEISGSLYRVHGNLGVDYQFHRRWQVGTTYRRSMELAQQLGAPVLADAVSLDLSGLISRRVDVSTSVAYAKGESALTRTNNDLASYTGTAQARYAVTRWLAAYTAYHYFSYEVDSGFDLAPGLPSAIKQQGVRAGVTLWVSVF